MKFHCCPFFSDDTIFLFSKIAEAAKLKPLELELKKLEDLSDAIVQDFALMKKREEEMRDTNGKDLQMLKFSAEH